MPHKQLESSKQFLISAEEHRKIALFDYTRMLRKTFRESANVIFLDHPLLDSFEWCQNTNPDCDYEFFVNRLVVVVNGKTYEQMRNGRSYEQMRDEPMLLARKDISEFLDAFEDDDLLKLFGDHVKVGVSRRAIYLTYHDVDATQ
jgi:hypothetical protein